MCGCGVQCEAVGLQSVCCGYGGEPRHFAKAVVTHAVGSGQSNQQAEHCWHEMRWRSRQGCAGAAK
jgi:hypothetical protein